MCNTSTALRPREREGSSDSMDSFYASGYRRGGMTGFPDGGMREEGWGPPSPPHSLRRSEDSVLDETLDLGEEGTD
eukprot:495350-Prorocentrum_minimum.AAC.1